MTPANRRRAPIAMLLVLVLAATPTHAQPSGGDFGNGQSNAFGSISMSPYLAGPGPVTMEAVVRIADPGALPADGFVLFGFNALDATVHANVEGVFTPEGERLDAVPGTPTGDDRQPRYAVPASLLVESPQVVLRGLAWANGNGRFHVGALAMAFASDWSPITVGGEQAQLYAYGWLGARELSQAIPFSGQGNDAWALAPAIALVALCVFLWWLSGRPEPAGPRPQSFSHVPRRILTAPPQVRLPSRPARPVRPMPALRPPPRRLRPGEHPVRWTGPTRPPAWTTATPVTRRGTPAQGTARPTGARAPPHRHAVPPGRPARPAPLGR